MSIYLWPLCTHLMMDASSRIMDHVTKLILSQTGLWNTTMSSLYSSGLYSHQITICWIVIWWLWRWNSRFTSLICSWCYHVNMDQHVWGMFPTASWKFATKIQGSYEGKTFDSQGAPNIVAGECVCTFFPLNILHIIWPVLAIAVVRIPPSVDLHLALLSPSDLAGDQGHLCCPGRISSRGSREEVGWLTAAHVYSWFCCRHSGFSACYKCASIAVISFFRCLQPQTQSRR